MSGIWTIVLGLAAAIPSLLLGGCGDGSFATDFLGSSGANSSEQSGVLDELVPTTSPSPEVVGSSGGSGGDGMTAFERGPAKDVQFLMQATFGPTQTALDELSGLSYMEWIKKQAALPVESHRAFFRRRIAPKVLDAHRAAAVMDRCAKGARWVRHALFQKDNQLGRAVIEVKDDEILVNGQFRTSIDPDMVGNHLRSENCTNTNPPGERRECGGWAPHQLLNGATCRRWSPTHCRQTCWDAGEGVTGDDCSTWRWNELSSRGFVGKLCWAVDEVGGVVALDEANGNCQTPKYLPNPGIFLRDTTKAANAQEVAFVEGSPGILSLAEDLSPCPFRGYRFIKVGGDPGRYFVADDRLGLVDNAVENPAVAPDASVCMNVPMTFVNKADCKMQTSCQPAGASKDVSVPLDAAGRSLFFSAARKYVYEVRGLKATASPCNRWSRWRDCAACQPSSLNALDRDAIANELLKKDGWFRDITASCSNVPAGAVVQVGDSIFLNVHPNEFDVYDFTLWVAEHPGGMAKIEKWAKGDFILNFPPSHSMKRWHEWSNGRFIQRLGHREETIKYEDLPSTLQTGGVKRAFGQSAAETHWAACGSPNEVGTEGRFGSRFIFQYDFIDGKARLDRGEEGRRWNHYREYRTWDARGRVWMHHAVYANDQLRQRVAWALAQIFVVSAQGSGQRSLTEPWLNYYDIFLRNAFGSFYDILREVTYSPVMGGYLTYINNWAYDRTSRHPDENYAREIMQLFTIGLVMLEEDGSQVGTGVPTYTNEQIMEFARVFTGFEPRPDRGNYEDYRGTASLYDPMRQRATEGFHDIWPKRDLYGGYIGDGYPLCMDIPRYQFLAAGSEYEYAGKDLQGLEPVLDLASDSQLSKLLCAEQGGECQPSVLKQLPEELSCVGAECEAHARDIRHVKVGSALYTFKRPRCVHLHFMLGEVSIDWDEDYKVVRRIAKKLAENRFSVVPLTRPAPPLFPCTSPCSASGSKCRCPARSFARQIFDRLPLPAQVKQELSVGAFVPTIAPFAKAAGISAFHPKRKYDTDTVFEVDGRYWRNVRYVVEAKAPENATYRFRNPVEFTSWDSTRRVEEAYDEIEAVLDHLVHHQNTAPFFAIRLIQRLVTSNPSRSYVKSVAQAFKRGTCVDEDGKMVRFSGKYGDIGAATCATLMHREARAPKGSTVGSLREPVVKIAHLLRAMGYDTPNREQYGTVLDIQNLQSAINQWPHESPSVFNFYTPFFRPAGFDGRNLPKDLVSPEFEILTPDALINFVNGMSSTIRFGEIGCSWGFTFRSCNRGQFGFSVEHPAFGDNATAVVDKLDLWLTGSRMSPRSRAAVETAFKTEQDAQMGFKYAQVAAVITPEFNALGEPFARGERAPAPPPPEKVLRSYKAMVLVFMKGGADTWNMLMPHTSCALYAQYKTARSNLALTGDEMFQIGAAGQPCASFGVHSAMDGAKSLYDKGQLAFVSNIGSLVHPMSKASFRMRNVTRCQGLFSHSDQVNGISTMQCQVPGASIGGFGGRMGDELAKSGYATNTISISTKSVWPEGKTMNPTIVGGGGIKRLEQYPKVWPVVENISRSVYDNIYLEEYAQSLGTGVRSNEELSSLIGSATLKTDINRKKGLSQQLAMVSKLVSLRKERQAERDLFYVVINSWDHHKELKSNLNKKLVDLDTALAAFAKEMEAQGMWENVVVATSSDFARTLTSNGQGTDHAWAGNHMVLGGQVNGGQVHNEFPRELKKGGVQDIGRGRLVPKYPWESMMQPIAEWMGVTDGAALDRTFPNRKNFPQGDILKQAVLFK